MVMKSPLVELRKASVKSVAGESWSSGVKSTAMECWGSGVRSTARKPATVEAAAASEIRPQESSSEKQNSQRAS